MYSPPSPTVSGLSEFDLLNLNPDDGSAPESRVRDVAAALSIYSTLFLADEKSATNRSRVDAMFDGATPYDPTVIASTGQGNRTNLNWGEAQRYLDISMSAFVDLNSSLERLVSLKTTKGEPSAREEANDIVSEEATHTIREWPSFHGSYMRLCNEFTKQGVGVTYFDNPVDWRFRVSGLSEFLIPRQTEASEENIEVAASRRQYLLHELYALVRDEEKAKAKGWNVEEIKRIIMKNAKTTGTSGAVSTDWEATQRELKNNDLHTGMQNTTVSIIHMWVREFKGKVSFLMFAEQTPKDFILNKPAMFDRPEQAFVFFTYGVGSNGTYHSIRGLGHRIFNHIQTSNRMRCHRVDSAMLGGSVMLQPETQRALEDLSFTMYGPYSILSPNVRVVEKAAPDLTKTMDPALADLENQLAMNVDLSSAYGNKSSPYRNNLQTEHDLAVSSTLTGSTLNLFYAGWNRLMREVCQRLVNGPKNDPAVAAFYARCLERGVLADVVKSIAHHRTTAVKAIGSGSAANRLLALRELNGISGAYDEVGRRNLIRDITSERVGRDLVNRYAPPKPEPRTTSESKIAFLENQSLQNGQPVPVFDGELHGLHLRVHAPLLQQLLDAINSGQADPIQLLPMVQGLHQHCSEHVTYLANDAAAQQEVAEMKQLLQQAEEVIVNFTRKIQAEQRKMAEAGAEAGAESGEQPEGPTEADLKRAAFDQQQEISARKAEQEMDIKERKANQDIQLKDAKRAMELEGVTQS